MSEYDDPELEALLRSLDDDGVPELARLGLLTESRIDYEPDFTDVARKLAELRAAAEPHADEYGYLWEVTAAEVDEAARRAIFGRRFRSASEDGLARLRDLAPGA